MKLQTIHLRFFIVGNRNTKEQSLSLEIQRFLGMPGICLPKFREKKTGTSVIAKSSTYSASHSPPPVRPMVEKNPFIEIPERQYGSHNLIKECA